jgi:bleomycin hydrolase
MKRTRRNKTPTKSRAPKRRRASIDISPEFLESCAEEFKQNPVHVIARNAVASVGSALSTTNSNRANEISHIFMNTGKKKDLKATDQGHSGRCWMFAALNTFRHVMIRALNLENFEFSETYLFFFDKLERCNSYLRWFIDNPDASPGDRSYDYMIMDYLGDGGWWNTFANLVMKYGLVPKEAMKETYQSAQSDDLNQILKEHVDSCANYILLNRNRKSRETLLDAKNQTMKHVYNALVKFLGEPPKKFNWNFTSDDGDCSVVSQVTPSMFLQMVAPGVDMNKDFVSLAHVPTRDFPLNTKFRIKYTNNVHEGENCTLYNVSIDELSKYAMKSIAAGIAVWFVADVSQSFNWWYSALDDELDDHKLVFGHPHKFTKGDRITLRNVQGNHAMALTGFNVDQNGNPINWQVENSWGYYDNETPGLDGFLTMSHSWFKKYVMEVVINKGFLSRTMKRAVEKDATEVDPWDSMAPAVRAGVVNPPRNYKDILGHKTPM